MRDGIEEKEENCAKERRKESSERRIDVSRRCFKRLLRRMTGAGLNSICRSPNEIASDGDAANLEKRERKRKKKTAGKVEDK